MILAPLLTGQVISSIAPSAPTAANVLAPKALDEREKKLILPKPNFEARKTGRKLVRPRIMKPEDSQVDSEMLEAEGSDNSTKQTLSQNTVEIHGTPMLQAPQPVRKRPSTPSTSELQESTVQDETSFEITEPTQKKPKNSENPLDGGEEQPSENEGQPATASENSEVLPATDESREDVADLPSEIMESVDADKDETEADGKHELSIMDAKRQEEFQNDRSDIAEESLNKVNDAIESDDPFYTRNEQEIQQQAIESGSEREEGELPIDIGDLEGGSSMPNAMGSPEPGELLSEHATTSDNPTGIDEEALDVTAAEAGEIDPSQGIYDDKNEEGNVTEDIGESSERLSENIEQPAAEPEEVSEATTISPEITSTGTAVELGAPRQGGPNVSADTDGKQPSRSSTTINLNERAKERAKERQAAMLSRGRGRSTRGRGGRSARGQSKQA